MRRRRNTGSGDWPWFTQLAGRVLYTSMCRVLYMTDHDDPFQLAKLGKQRAAARQRAGGITERLRQAVIQSSAAGMTEAQIARLASIDRMTVRSWLGK